MVLSVFFSRQVFQGEGLIHRVYRRVMLQVRGFIERVYSREIVQGEAD